MLIDETKILAGYMRFQIIHALPPVLNLGVGSNPCGISGDDVVQFDIDRWEYPRFVQGDAHELPFLDDVFETAICGDVFEHLLNPAKVLREMRRVARRLVITVFEEWRLPGEGQHVQVGHDLFPDQGIRDGHILSFFPEGRMSHGPHINQFTLPGLLKLFKEANLQVVVQQEDSPGVHEGHRMKNWMFVLQRSRA